MKNFKESDDALTVLKNYYFSMGKFFTENRCFKISPVDSYSNEFSISLIHEFEKINNDNDTKSHINDNNSDGKSSNRDSVSVDIDSVDSNSNNNSIIGGGINNNRVDSDGNNIREILENIDKYTIPTIKIMLKEKNLMVTGRKEDLIERLKTYYLNGQK